MATPAAQLTRKDFTSDQTVRWCPGCGDYSILANIQRVMPELGLSPEKVVFVSGIGCSSRFPYYMDTYGFHTIHGRAPAFATGIKASNPDLSVWVVTGDGDGLAIGGNHLLHIIRRNVDVNILLFNNRVYGLTKGQYSPTSRVGMKTKSTPLGSIDHPIDPLSFALGAAATFVARTVDVDAEHMQYVFRRAQEHRGTSFIEILQNCPVFNDKEWDELEDKKQRVDAGLRLQHGQPLVTGSEGRRRGIRIDSGVPAVIDLADGADISTADIAVHNENHHSPAYAFALASMERPNFPLPIGVFRAVESATYDGMLEQQMEQAMELRGAGDLRNLLHSGETWTVK